MAPIAIQSLAQVMASGGSGSASRRSAACFVTARVHEVALLDVLGRHRQAQRLQLGAVAEQPVGAGARVERSGDVGDPPPTCLMQMANRLGAAFDVG